MTPKDFATIVSDQITAAQARAAKVLDTTVGSIVRAVLEAVAYVALWLQGLIFDLLGVTRAATAEDADLDSWMADYGLTRIGAGGAQGQVTFARFTPTSAATVALLSLVQTADGTQKYQVIADLTNPHYNSGTQTYTLPIGLASLPILCQAVTAGAASNVGAGLVNTLGQAIPFIDTVNNVAAMAGGADAESDAAFRLRFQNYLGSLSKATQQAVVTAITSVPGLKTYKIVENYQANGAYDPGYFYVVVDDGTGDPPGSLVTACLAAVDPIRALGIRFGVFGASPRNVTVVMNISIAAGFVFSDVQTNVITQETAFFASLGVGQTLPYTQVSAVAYASGGVTSVTGLTLNSGTSDIVPTSSQKVRLVSITVNQA